MPSNLRPDWRVARRALDYIGETVASARASFNAEFSGPTVGGGYMLSQFDFDPAGREAVLRVATTPADLPGSAGAVVIGT